MDGVVWIMGLACVFPSEYGSGPTRFYRSSVPKIQVSMLSDRSEYVLNGNMGFASRPCQYISCYYEGAALQLAKASRVELGILG